MTRFRARHKREIGSVFIRYFDMKEMSGTLLQDFELHEFALEHEKKKYDIACKVFPTIEYLHDFCVSRPFKSDNDHRILTKEDKLEAMNVMIDDVSSSLEKVQNLFRGTAKITEDKIKAEIRALEWYRNVIEEGIL